MDKNSYVFLTAEIVELEKLLAKIPLENAIERLGFEYRLREAKSSLAQLPIQQLPKKITLTFRGKPVHGTRGIMADFAAKATTAFADTFAMVAANLKGSLSSSGPIPDREKHQLLITGTAIGSFGFEFELPSDSPVQEDKLALLQERTIELKPIEKIVKIFESSLNGNDDELIESIEDIYPRTIKKIYEFLDILQQENAFFTMHVGSRQISYPSTEDVQRASLRLKSDNILEQEEYVEGQFQGILPMSRAFEFLSNDATVIKGRIGQSIGDVSKLSHEWLHKPAGIRLIRRSLGQGRPSYTLESLDCLTALPHLNS